MTLRHHEVIHLLSSRIIEDDIGNQIEEYVERKVYANEFSVSATEYYNAAVAGMRPSKSFEIYSFEYNGEEKLKHNGVIYRIVRAETRGEKTRITCERVAADG
ncbi:phage head closure protein [Geobacillus stearothermophilus]|nr:phage head closure protein [Geobacillus stearothermophilus]